MKILISNDDGICAPGIVLLSNDLAARGHTVTVVAPDRARSGAGHSITTEYCLFLRKGPFPGYDESVRTFMCNGTPADCVMAGLHLAEPEADLVLAGINRGSNLGCDVYYSGTVGAAREAYFENRRAIAVSLYLGPGRQDRSSPRTEHYETAVAAVGVLLDHPGIFPLPEGPTCLNVNVPNLPPPEVRGFRATFTGRRRYENRIRTTPAPNGEEYFWVTGSPVDRGEEEGSDVKAIKEGFITLTFLRHDETDWDLNEHLDSEKLQKIKLG
ncbi:MAG: 5'/3'-nucleotidase SurE [Synergistaceae bacterium]|jgi:5'-nucleotidase|nr:5'/3'-nucleotidase SurE [Synergistaceae bacterium]